MIRRLLPAAQDRILALCGTGLALCIFVLDTFTESDFAVAVFYSFVIVIASRILSRRGVLYVFAICLALTATSYLAQHGDSFSAGIFRAGSSIAAMAITTVLALKYLSAIAELRKRAGLLDASHDAIFARGLDDRITYWSDGARELFGWTSEEAIGRTCADLLRSTFPMPLEEIKSELIRRGRWEGELVHTTRDGSSITAASRWALQRDHQHEPIAILETDNDITERKAVEDELRSAKQELRITLDSIPALVVRSSLHGTAEFVNASWAAQGFSDSDLYAGPDRLIHPDDLAAYRKANSDSIRTGESYQIEIRLRQANGDYRWYLVRAIVLFDPAGNPLKRYATATDIEDRKQAEDSLRRREFELRQIVDTIPTLVWSVTPDGSPSYFNKRMEDYYGQHTGDGGGLGEFGLDDVLSRIVHPDDCAPVLEAMKRSLHSGEPFAMRYRSRRSDGIYRWVDARAEPLRNAEGDIARWYGVSIDVDDEIRAQEALRSTQESLARASHYASLSELSASIAHEVNQPLTAIITNGNACRRWLAASPSNVPRATATLERIIRNAGIAANVVERVRALFVRRTVDSNAMDVNQVVSEVRQLMTQALAADGVAVAMQLQANLPPVRADNVQIQQVLVNLIRNAIDAMKSNTDAPRSLIIRSRREGEDMVAVEVQDNGPGLSDPEVIFEPFFTTKADGMGMGLAVSRSIIDLHDGRLWAQNVSPSGAVFSLALQIDQTDGHPGGAQVRRDA